MPRANVDLIAFNRGLVSPLALARTDIDRTRLSASRMTNWLPKTQGAMRIRPGSKYLGSSKNDTGAEWIEFIASTDDSALIEITPGVIRVWDDDELLSRDTGLSTPVAGFTGTDTGAWVNASTGGTVTVAGQDLIPRMTAATSSGVTIAASSDWISDTGGNYRAWKAGDNNTATYWQDTGNGSASTLPSWLKVDFGTAKTVGSYTVRAGPISNHLDNAPRSWFFEGNDVDTGSDASWTVLDTGGHQTGWSISQKRTFTVGSPAAYRFYRLRVMEVNGDTECVMSELELLSANSGQVRFQAGSLYLNAISTGGLAKATQEVTCDTGNIDIEHALEIEITRGPVTFRCGSSDGADDYVRETALGTGRHSLSFVPTGNFYLLFQTDEQVDRIVGSISLSAGGIMELVAPWTSADLENIRYDQSADVVYVNASAVKQRKIERRGDGRSWSVVEYAPLNGPFLPYRSSGARLKVAQTYGNTTLTADQAFFDPGHVGALFRLFHNGQGGTWVLGRDDVNTDAIEVTGINDTGSPSNSTERRLSISGSGTWAGTVTVQRSFDGPDIGFHDTTMTDTGTFSRTIIDPDNNVTVWYRLRIKNGQYTSGALVVSVTYGNGGVTGICRVTGYQSTTVVDVEVLKRFSSTNYSDNWNEGFWSDAQGYPSAVGLHEGRLFHAGGANVFGSVSDDYENFDDETEGDAGPIVRTIGRGPIDASRFLLPLLRLIIGTTGSEIAVRSSSLDEPLTPTNSSAKPVSTQGVANLRAVVIDDRGCYVQRSGSRVFTIEFGQGAQFGDYVSRELTLLVPNLLDAGVVSVAVQRQPDTRLHCVLDDGVVGIMTFEAQEEVLCWSLYETDGFVEKAMVLPGLNEDQVFYHVRRTINGVTKRFLEKWALETESEGGQLSWIADSAVSLEDTGGFTEMTGLDHLVGERVCVWANDTGQASYGKDLSPDVAGVQTLYTVDTGGNITLPGTFTKAVAGLPYTADWTSTKMAYAAAMGTGLTQPKRISAAAFILAKTHNNGLFFGGDTGRLDPLPRKYRGQVVDTDLIHEAFDEVSVAFPGTWGPDERVHLRAKAPRPVTVMATVPTLNTNDKA